jgi:hypothetical protein
VFGQKAFGQKAFGQKAIIYHIRTKKHLDKKQSYITFGQKHLDKKQSYITFGQKTFGQKAIIYHIRTKNIRTRIDRTKDADAKKRPSNLFFARR